MTIDIKIVKYCAILLLIDQYNLKGLGIIILAIFAAVVDYMLIKKLA